MDYSKKELEGLLQRKYSIRSANYSFAADSDCIKPNWHEKYEFILVNSGCLTITLNNILIDAFSGTLIVVSPNILHSAHCKENGCNYSVISFEHKSLLDNSVYEQALRNSLLNHTLKIDNIINDINAITHFDNLYNICNDKKKSQPILEKGYACIFFSYLIENFSKDTNPHQANNPKFENILDYISQNFTKPISTKKIAERFSYNESYFCRKFQEVTNLTPTEFILKLRIEHSQKLMTTSTFSLNDIAQQSGFSSYPYFSAKFKQQVGISPAEWRGGFLKNNKI